MTIRFENSVEALLERVPAFADARAHDSSFISYMDPEPYLVFGDFGRFLKDLIVREPQTAGERKTLAEALGVIEDMANSTDVEVLNLVVVCVFETLTGYPKAVTFAQQHLSGKALDLFMRVKQGWVLNT